jgi:UDP:flavonoid glycosyltransferase YjiC (YdhE family)
MTAEKFRGLATDSGLSFTPLASGERAQDHAEALWEMSTDPEAFLDHHFVAWNRAMYQKILELHSAGPTVVVTSYHGDIVADALAHEHKGTPLVRLLLQPGPAAYTPGINPLSGLDRNAGRSAQWVFQLTSELGLPLIAEPLRVWAKRVLQSVPVWALWPAWFARGIQGSPHVLPLGFVRDTRYDRSCSPRRPGAPRKIVFTLGTLGTDPAPWVARYYDFAEEICALLGCSGFFLGASEPPPGSIQSGRLQCHEFLPLAEALANCDLLVHHAGIGTVSEGLAHGVPHLVIPRIWGQTDNAATLKVFGVAEELNSQDFTARAAMASIQRLCETEEVQARCDYLKSLIDQAQTVPRICDLLERGIHEPLPGSVNVIPAAPQPETSREQL